ERIAAVLEAVIPADHLRVPHVEGVSLAEMGTVIGVRNAAILATAAVASNGLCLLPSGGLCLALRLLGTLWLRSLGALWLGSLGALRLGSLSALRLGFLGALRLGFLGALWLGFLGALRLRLALRLRGFSSALFLFAFLCECRKGGPEKY